MQTKMKKKMRLASTAVLFTGALAPTGAYADVTINEGLGVTHESNINGSPVKSAQLSDNYTTLNASAVYYTPLDSAQTTYFIGQVGALASKYDRYSNLDNATLITSAGLYQQFSSNWSGQVTGRGFSRDSKQNQLDSKGWGSTFEIKNQLTSNVWINGIADYEDSKANLSSFGYTGKTLGLSVGYLPLQDTFTSVGYSHNTRDFNTSAAFKTTAQTYFASASQRLTKNWYLIASYAFQNNTSNIAGTGYKDNILSAAVNYSY